MSQPQDPRAVDVDASEPGPRADPRRRDVRHGASVWLGLLGWVALSAAAGAVGTLASRGAGDFYSLLSRPAWAPPGWLFGPVWSMLYLLMGIAAWLVWRAEPAGLSAAASRRQGLVAFVIQLALNALWTWIFFAWREGAMAFAEIAALWLAIGFTAWHFSRVRAVAAWCLVPYLAWVTYAMALTWAVWRANPGQL